MCENGWTIYPHNVLKRFGPIKECIYINIFYNFHHTLCISTRCQTLGKPYKFLRFEGCYDYKMLKIFANIIDKVMLNFDRFEKLIFSNDNANISIDVDLILNNCWLKGGRI